MRKILPIDINKVLCNLSEERPIFHSEADFQHSLAWIIHEKYPHFNVRLEKKENVDGKDIYLDIFLFEKGRIDEPIMIELKYKTEKLTVNIKEEFFELTNQGAHDQARYDFLKDISRIESLIEQKYPKGMGITIFLTNDRKYWELPEKDIDTVDKEFRIHEGRIIKKTTLKWKKGTSKGTKSGREEPICLKGDYHLSWQKYSCSDKYLFKYLAIVIKDL